MSINDGDRTLLHSVTLYVQPGGFHCLIGESGSGKSLLSRTILDMKDARLQYQGEIDIDLTCTDAIFQDSHSNLIQNMTLKQHFDMLYRAHHQNKNSAERQQHLIQMMTQLGLNQPEQLLHAYPFELSGGMAQRFAFMMALIRRPKLLILDEPTSALDQANARKFMDYLKTMIKRYHMTILFITHDLNLVEDVATHISIMKAGEILESGTREDIFETPQHAYAQQLVAIARRRKQYVNDDRHHETN